MEIHIYNTAKPSHFNETAKNLIIHYGPDWWLEEDEITGYSTSYKIIHQFTGIGKNESPKRAICVQRMPRNWVGDFYLGNQTGVSYNRIVFKNIKEVPCSEAVWKMLVGGL